MMSKDLWAPFHLPAGSEDGHRGLCLEMANGQGPPNPIHAPFLNICYPVHEKGLLFLYFCEGPLLQRTSYVLAQEFPSWWNSSLDTAEGGVWGPDLPGRKKEVPRLLLPGCTQVHIKQKE